MFQKLIKKKNNNNYVLFIDDNTKNVYNTLDSFHQFDLIHFVVTHIISNNIKNNPITNYNNLIYYCKS